MRKQPDHHFFRGHTTYLSGLREEIQEAEEEIIKGRQVYLEDELGDIFWDYLCLIETLNQEGRINRDRIFERCYKKFSERIPHDGMATQASWEIVKNRQKKNLEDEHN